MPTLQALTPAELVAALNSAIDAGQSVAVKPARHVRRYFGGLWRGFRPFRLDDAGRPACLVGASLEVIPAAALATVEVGGW